MTDVFIDANVCIYLTIPHSAFYTQSIELLEKLAHEDMQFVTTPYVLNEFHYSMLKLYDKTRAKEQMETFFNTIHVNLYNPALSQPDISEICVISEQYNLKTFDAYHAYTCKKLGIKNIATFDTDFERIPWLKVWKK